MTTKTFICTFLLVTCAISSAFSASRTWPASCRGAGDPLTDSPGLQFDMDPTAYCSITDGATYTWNEYLENGSVRGGLVSNATHSNRCRCYSQGYRLWMGRSLHLMEQRWRHQRIPEQERESRMLYHYYRYSGIKEEGQRAHQRSYLAS